MRTFCFLKRNAVTVCFLVLSYATVAQRYDLSPTISIGGNIYPARSLKDQSGTYGRQAAYARITVPIIKTFTLTDSGLKFFLLSAGLHTSAENAKFSFLGFNRTFYTANFSLRAMYKTYGKSSWFSRAALSSFEDDSSIHLHPSFRVTGFLLYRHAVNESFFYMFGGAYNFVYGAGIPLPVLGMGWKFANQATLTAILPFNVTYRFGKRGSQYTIFIKPNGGVSNFYNNAFSVNKGSTIILRRREILLGIKKNMRLSDHWSIGLEGGFAAGRKISFSNSFTQRQDENFPSYTVKGGPYFSLGIRFKFRERKFNNTASDTMDDHLDLDTLLPNY